MKNIKIFILLLFLVSFLFVLQSLKDKIIIDKLTSKGIIDSKATLIALGLAVNVDANFPIIYIASPTNTTYSFNNSINLNFTIVENSLDKIYYNIDNQNNITITGNTTFSVNETTMSHILTLFANDTFGRLNSSSVTFSINLSSTPSPSPSPGEGGTSGGAGGGSGGGKAIFSLEDFSISESIIKIELKQGESKIKTLGIENTGRSNLDLSVDLEGLKEFLIFPGGLSKLTLSLKPKEKQSIQLIFNAAKDAQAGVHPGRIIISSSSIRKTITTIVEVESIKKIFDVELRLTKKSVIRGESLVAEINIFNLGQNDERVDTQVEIGVKDLDGTIIVKEDSRIAVQTQASFTQDILIPRYVKEGNYVLYAIVRFDNQTGTTSEIFQVLEEPSANLNLIIYLITILIFVVLSIMIIEYFKHHKKEKITVNELTLKSKEQIKKLNNIKSNINELNNESFNQEEIRKIIRDLFRYREEAKYYKAQLINFTDKLKDKLREKEITLEEYNNNLRKSLRGKTLKQWINNYDSLIEYYNKELRRLNK